MYIRILQVQLYIFIIKFDVINFVYFFEEFEMLNDY